MNVVDFSSMAFDNVLLNITNEWIKKQTHNSSITVISNGTLKGTELLVRHFNRSWNQIHSPHSVVYSDWIVRRGIDKISFVSRQISNRTKREKKPFSRARAKYISNLCIAFSFNHQLLSKPIYHCVHIFYVEWCMWVFNTIFPIVIQLSCLFGIK